MEETQQPFQALPRNPKSTKLGRAAERKLVRLFLSGSGWTAEKLAEKFGVCARTVYAILRRPEHQELVISLVRKAKA